MTEFNRTVRIDMLRTELRTEAIEADADERAALARRFEILSIGSLTAKTEVRRQGSDVYAEGRLKADVAQSCVATGVELTATIDAPFKIVFRPEMPIEAPDAGIELSEAECDVVFYSGGAIDLGEAVAETLALALDPYPRAPDADAVLKEAGVFSEAQAGPFAALATLKNSVIPA